MATTKKTEPAAPAKKVLTDEAKAILKSRVKARDAALLALSRKHADEFRALLVAEFAARGLEYQGRPRLSDAEREARRVADAEKAAKALARAKARAAKAGVAAA